MKLFEKITKGVYLKQHRNFFKSSAYKRMLDVYKNPKSFYNEHLQVLKKSMV